MAKKYVYSVRDRGADCFGAPFFASGRGQAFREFGDAVNRQSDMPIHLHPEDFDLYELGTFEDSTGMFEVGVPEMVLVGKDVRVKLS